jgi:hypothetical protein
MQYVIIINIFVVVLAYFSKYNYTKSLFKVAFLIIFLTTALRFNFGTDYMNYYKAFNIVKQSYSITSINFIYFDYERAWLILNYISKPIGFFGFIIILSAFLCYTYYALIKKYVAPKYYWLAIFIYVFTFDIMWIQFSALRQALAIAIFIHSVKYLNETENPVLYVLLIIIAGMFHTSAYFMLSFVIFKLKKIRESKIIGVVILTIFFGMMFYGTTYLPKFIEFTSFVSGERYIDLFDSELYISSVKITLIGSIAWSSLLFVLLYYSRFQQKNKKVFYYIASLYSLVYVLSQLVWLSDRIGYYFIALSTIVYPMIIQQEKRFFIRISLVGFFISFILYRFTTFFKLDWVISGYSEYNTIISEIF